MSGERDWDEAPAGSVTALLRASQTGDAKAEEELLDLVYGELRRRAALRMRRERPDHTLGPTALVNEAYLRLIEHPGNYRDRAHFLAVAASAMRRILVDYARSRQSSKRAGQRARVGFEGAEALAESPENILLLNKELDHLAEISSRTARVVELRFFGGLSYEEIAEVLDLNPRTVRREWEFAKAWLRGRLSSERHMSGGGSTWSAGTQPARVAKKIEEPRPDLIAGRYSIRERLGEGGFSIAHLAADVENKDHLVVVKVFKAETGKLPARGTFAQELAAMQRLRHPNTARVLDIGQMPDGRPFMVREYLPGKSLRELIAPDGWPVPRTLTVIEKVCDVVEEAHRNNVLHLDLKPENIIIDETLEPKVIDFGSARLMDLGAFHVPSGSPNYMAREIFEGEPTVRSDVFALAVITHELLTGRLPPEITAESGEDLFDPKIPATVAAALRKALQPDAIDSFGTVAEFRAALTHGM